MLVLVAWRIVKSILAKQESSLQESYGYHHELVGPYQILVFQLMNRCVLICLWK